MMSIEGLELNKEPPVIKILAEKHDERYLAKALD